MWKWPWKSWPLLFGGLIGIAGCSGWVLDEAGVFDNREVAVPLFHTRFTLPEAMTGGANQVIILPDGSVALEYSSQELALQAKELIPVLPTGLPIPLPDTTSRIPVPSASGWTPSGVTFKQTRFLLYIFYQSDQPITFWLEAPQAITASGPWIQRFDLPAKPTAGLWLSPVVDLDGVSMDLPGGEIVLKYGIEAGNLPDAFSVTITFSSIDFYALSGGLARMQIDLPSGELPIDVFENWNGGAFSVENPELTVTIRNSFGIPVNLQVDQLAVVDAQGNAADMVSDVVADPIAIAYPAVHEQGTDRATILAINRDNSNIESLIQQRPLKVVYQVQGTINPDKLAGPFFVLDSSRVEIDSRFSITLAGTLASYLGVDTFPLQVPVYDVVEQAAIRWTTTNETPLSLSIQAALFDDAYNPLGELWEGWADVALGAASGAISKQQVDLPITTQVLDKLSSAAYMVIRYEMKTAGDAPVRVFADEHMECEVGLNLTIARE